MFQPNSIRSLLSKRKSQRAQSAKQQQTTKDASTIQSGLDPDYDSIIQVKMMTKEIQHQIQSIRQWRQHQKQLMKQKLKSNSVLANELNQAHIKNLQKQAQRDEQQLKKILKQLNSATQIKIKQNQEIFDTQRIFNVLNETDKLRQKLKNSSIETKPEDNYGALVSEMDQMNHIFKKDVGIEQASKGEPHKIDSELLKKQMDQIEDQLRQIQQLLADDDQKPKQKKGAMKKQ